MLPKTHIRMVGKTFYFTQDSSAGFDLFVFITLDEKIGVHQRKPRKPPGSHNICTLEPIKSQFCLSWPYLIQEGMTKVHQNSQTPKEYNYHPRPLFASRHYTLTSLKKTLSFLIPVVGPTIAKSPLRGRESDERPIITSTLSGCSAASSSVS